MMFVQNNCVMVSESIVRVETSGGLLGTRSPKVPFGTVNPRPKPRFLGESSGIGPKTLFRAQKIADPMLQTAIFGQDLNFQSLHASRHPNQQILKMHSISSCILHVQVECAPFHLVGRGVYPVRWGLGFYAPQPRATPMMSPSWGQNVQFKVRAPPDQMQKKPNDIQIINISQFLSAMVLMRSTTKICQIIP